MDQLKLGQRFYPPVVPASGQPPLITRKPNLRDQADSVQRTTSALRKATFAEHLQQKISERKEIKFSHHAQQRLSERGIELSTEQLQRLQVGVERAEQKGARESLFILEDVAFVVSVKNKTVITAMEKESMHEQIITNIDSAVLL